MGRLEFFVVTGGADETVDLGRKIGGTLVGGEVIALVGQLGSGKTHLIKGIASGLGASDSDEVNSPTFVLVNEYQGPNMRLDAYHIDAYRLNRVEEFEMLGFDDLCYPDSVVMVEWADKVAGVLGGIDCMRVELAHKSSSEREIKIKNITREMFDALS